jgi:hypothetical protein
LSRVLQCCCWALLVSVTGAVLAPAALAKGGHGGQHAQHGKATGSNTGPKTESKTGPKSSPGTGGKAGPQAPAASGSRGSAAPGGQSKGDATAPSGEPAVDKGPAKPLPANVGLKPQIKPQLPPIPHNTPASAPVSTVTRNAIGMPVAAPAGTPAAVGAHVPNAPAGAIGPAAKRTVLPMGHPSPTPNAGAAAGVGGAGVIRGVQTTSALGGPAKAATGINGSTFRTKH